MKTSKILLLNNKEGVFALYHHWGWKMDLLWQPQTLKNHLRPRPILNIDAKTEYAWKEGKALYLEESEECIMSYWNLIKESQGSLPRLCLSRTLHEKRLEYETRQHRILLYDNVRSHITKLIKKMLKHFARSAISCGLFTRLCSLWLPLVSVDSTYTCWGRLLMKTSKNGSLTGQPPKMSHSFAEFACCPKGRKKSLTMDNILIAVLFIS